MRVALACWYTGTARAKRANRRGRVLCSTNSLHLRYGRIEGIDFSRHYPYSGRHRNRGQRHHQVRRVFERPVEEAQDGRRQPRQILIQQVGVTVESRYDGPSGESAGRSVNLLMDFRRKVHERRFVAVRVQFKRVRIEHQLLLNLCILISMFNFNKYKYND